MVWGAGRGREGVTIAVPGIFPGFYVPLLLASSIYLAGVNARPDMIKDRPAIPYLTENITHACLLRWGVCSNKITFCEPPSSQTLSPAPPALHIEWDYACKSVNKQRFLMILSPRIHHGQCLKGVGGGVEGLKSGRTQKP